MIRPAAIAAVALLCAGPLTASTPGAWAAQAALARARCVKASGLRSAVASPPVIFSDTAGIDVLRVRGRYARGPAGGVRVTMLCLFERRTGKVEVQEAPPGW